MQRAASVSAITMVVHFGSVSLKGERGQQPEQLGLRIKYGLQIEHRAWIERRVRSEWGAFSGSGTSTTSVPPCGAFPLANELCN